MEFEIFAQIFPLYTLVRSQHLDGLRERARRSLLEARGVVFRSASLDSGAFLHVIQNASIGGWAVATKSSPSSSSEMSIACHFRGVKLTLSAIILLTTKIEIVG